MNYYLFEDEDLDINQVFELSELERFREMWEDGYGVSKISIVLNRKPIEIVLLILDQAELGKVIPRRLGLDGY